MTGKALILQADARALPLPDASVDLIVTSPPYWGLRSYTDGGEHYDGQFGSEPTPGEYLQSLLACTREWMRVLKPTGSMFVDLGDVYSSRADGSAAVSRRADRAKALPPVRSTTRFAPRKSLLLLPERYRIACLDELGLIVRATIAWDKSNPLPESVRDRVQRTHEDWVHLTKRERYFSAIDLIREQHVGAALTDTARGLGYARHSAGDGTTGDRATGTRGTTRTSHPLGRVPGSVWRVPSERLDVPDELGVDHFAAFPTTWPRRIILGWSPSGICSSCGEGRVPVSDTAMIADRRGRKQRIVDFALDGAHGPDGRAGERWKRLVAITGEACACPEPTAPTRPAVVLDPFGGTGTTALVAKSLGRIGIAVDRSADYCRIAQWRTSDPGELAKALRVEKPRVELAGQTSLFDEADLSLAAREIN